PPGNTLEVPGEKTKDSGDANTILELYKTAAKAKRLRTSYAGRGSSSTLWNMWKQSRLPAIKQRVKEQSPNLDDAAAAQAVSAQLDARREKCSPDHVMELQLGGADSASNLRLLEQGLNEKAGSKLAGNIRSLRNNLKTQKPDLPDDAVLQFSEN